MRNLGVEVITQAEVNEKLGITASPMVDVDSTYTTQWTSRRVFTNYYGIHYELQIVEGVPTSANSPLRKDTAAVSYAAAGIEAGVFNAIKVLGVSALGSVPIIGAPLSIGITAYDAFSAIQDSLSTSTIIDNVTGVAVVSFTTHMRFVFVKVQGSADSEQLLCYSGNRVAYLVSTISIVDEYANGQLNTYHNIECDPADSSESQYYSNYYALAAQNYHSFRSLGNPTFTFNYLITSVQFNFFGTAASYTVPYEYPLIEE